MVIKTLKNLSVPEETGCVFTRPDFKNWPFLLRKNKDSLTVIDNRSTSRSELVGIAAEYTCRMGLSAPHLKNVAEDIIVTGHQPNWHHCGIFAKNIVTDRFARQTCGIAVQLVLDHDICNTSMFMPESDDNGFLRFKTVVLEQKQQNISLESRPVPSREQIRKFIDSVSKTKDLFCSYIWCQNLHRIIETSQSCRSIADIITQLQARLNRAFSLEIFYLPVSLISQSNCFISFVCSIIFNAAHFVMVYNEAIRNKRQIYNLKSNRTIRPLKTDYLNSITELPFWLVSQTRKRTSLYVSLNNRNVQIGTTENALGTIDSSGDKTQQFFGILRKNKCIIRPKAVTLTLFSRLYLADLFVHGTGAQNYEYITDHLIRDYYKISKLDFGVATATMTLPAGINSWYPQTAKAYLQQKKNKISKQVINHREFFFGLFQKHRLEKLADFNEVQNEDRLNSCSSS